MRVERRRYTMSEAALAQRRANQASASSASTGPRTPEGKSRSRLNALKFGEHAQSLGARLAYPCRTTCPDYDGCIHVDTQQVVPGDRCPEQVENILNIIGDIHEAVSGGDMTKFRDLMAIRLAGNVDILARMQEAIIEDGVLLKETIVGENSTVTRHVEHPLLHALIKLSAQLNLSPADHKLTPKSREGDGDDKKSDLGSILASAIDATGKLFRDSGK